MRRFVKIFVIVVIVIVAYPAWLGFRIWSQSHDDEVHSADAIVVLGAAQYNGTPSPVFKARLDHALYLYQQGLSHTIITTGGKQPGDNYTESEAGQRYLEQQGVAPDRLLGEDTGKTTWQSLSNVSAIAQEQGIHSLLLVSDPLHSERLKIMAHDLGFNAAYTSWASYEALPRSRLTKLKELAYEVGSLLAFQLHLDR